MSRSKTLVGIIVLGLSLGASGCATQAGQKIQMSAEKMCTAHGNKWDAKNHTCNGLAAETTCANLIGAYNRAGAVCEFNP